MTGEEWTKGIENEAECVDDPAWAKEAQQAAYRTSRREQLLGAVGISGLTLAGTLAIWLTVAQEGLQRNAQLNGWTVGQYLWNVQTDALTSHSVWSSSQISPLFIPLLLFMALLLGFIAAQRNLSAALTAVIGIVGLPVCLQISQWVTSYPTGFLSFDTPTLPLLALLTLAGWYGGRRFRTHSTGRFT